MLRTHACELVSVLCTGLAARGLFRPTKVVTSECSKEVELFRQGLHESVPCWSFALYSQIEPSSGKLLLKPCSCARACPRGPVGIVHEGGRHAWDQARRGHQARVRLAAGLAAPCWGPCRSSRPSAARVPSTRSTAPASAGATRCSGMLHDCSLNRADAVQFAFVTGQSQASGCKPARMPGPELKRRLTNPAPDFALWELYPWPPLSTHKPKASSTAVSAFSRWTSSTLGLPPSAGPPAGQERLCRTCHP